MVLNKGGGNGAEAFLDLKLAKGNARKLVIGTNNVYLLPLVARLGYQWTDLTPVAAVAEDDFIPGPTRRRRGRTPRRSSPI